MPATPSGDPVADKIIRGVIGIVEQSFPGRVRGYYLRGSYASGTRTPGSDLDMFVVFRDAFDSAEQARQARRLCDYCALLSPLLLEIITVSEQQLQRGDNLVVALQLKLASVLLHGEDVRPRLPELQVDSYVREVVHVPYYSYAYPPQRRHSPFLTFPLRHIDPDGEFFGFDQWQVPDPDGQDVPSTKLLVGSVGWTATALIALETGEYVRDKSECVEKYRECIGDQWTDLVVEVHERCRNQWHYRIPSAGADRRQLRALCDRALAFQNHFLGHYRTYQLAELRSGVRDRQLLAARRLGQVRFGDREVVAALHDLAGTGDLDLGRAVEAALGGEATPLSGRPA